MQRRRARIAAAAGVTALATAITGLTVAAQSAGASPTPTATPDNSKLDQSVIVVLRDQLTSTPATRAHVARRGTLARSDQASVLAGLKGPKPIKVKHYVTGNAFAATVTKAELAALRLDPAVASVVPDSTVQLAPPSPAQAKAVTPNATPADVPSVPASACTGTESKPQLEPEALQTINARSDDPNAKTAASLGIDGTGVSVAFIADGIDPNAAGFKRADGTSSITDYKDFYGDGPNAVTSGAEAFGDASAISAQGNVAYDVSTYSNPSVVTQPGGHCWIRIVGVAPGSTVVALKAGSELLPNSSILQAIDYAVTTAHVNVINESFGANVYPDNGARNTIALFNDAAVQAGVTVVSSSGDAGISSTIGSPATDPNVISAGASTDSRLYEQTGYALATQFGNGKWLDSNISSLSSAGITQDGRTIDVSAPGEADWAVCENSSEFEGCTGYQGTGTDIQAFGGTSQASPITAGVAALVIQAYRKTHNGDSPTPAVVKQIITSTATDLGVPGDEQGSGLINARAAVEAAFTWPGATAADIPSGVSDNISLSASQLSLTGAPGSTQTGTVRVTNVGQNSQQIVATTRKYATVSSDDSTVSLDTTSSQTTPYPTTGAPWVYKKVTFTVPAGTDELRSSIRWQSGAGYNSGGPVVRLSLFAPDGTYAANTRPQGGADPANYGLATVAHPVAGTWTGVLYTPVKGGYTGKVAFDNDSTRALPTGSTTVGTTTLAPGASTDVQVAVTAPSVGGDTVYTTSVSTSTGHKVAIPVIVRALVQVPGRFSGVITGGNARASAPAQTFSYGFDVPAGKRDVEVRTSLANDPGYLLEGILIDPNGEIASVNSNNVAGKQGLYMQNTAAAPIAGRWRFVIVVISPVTGKQATESFIGSVQFNQIAVRASSAIPTTLKKGKATTLKLAVTNTGKAPMVVQTDARLSGSQQVQLAPQFAGSHISLPQSVDDLSAIPAYLVPPGTKALSVTAASTVPAQVELSNPGGGIDVFGDLRTAQGGNTISTASVLETSAFVGLGFWSPYVQEIGPFGDSGAPTGSSDLIANATIEPIDSAVRTSTGDPFVAATDPTADTGTPVVIQPGKTATITVTITPNAAKGARVTGVINLVTTPAGVANQFNTTGEVITKVHYDYRVS